MNRYCLYLILPLILMPNGVALSLGPYFVTDFGALPDGNGVGWARDVNSMGQVVGSSSTATGEQAFLWHPNVANGVVGEITALQDLEDGGDSCAFALNDFGQVVGRSSIDSEEQAFLWHPDSPNGRSGSAYGLGALTGGGDFSGASGINSIGQVVGYSQASSGLRAFLWQPTSDNSTTGSLFDLGDLPGGEDYSVGHDINDSGQVVGSSWTADERHPFIWNPIVPNASSGSLHDLGDLAGGRDEGGAIGINDAGEIVGYSSATSGFRGFHTDIDAFEPDVSDLVDLGDLPGGNDYSLARDINNHGQIVGVGTDNGQRAVTWTDSHHLIDLNDLLDPISGAGWTLNYASGINDAGQIVGYGTLNGSRRGFLLTPIQVPTPSSISLAAIQSIMVLALWRRKRRTARHRQHRTLCHVSEAAILFVRNELPTLRTNESFLSSFG